MPDILEGGVVDKVKARFKSTGWLHRKVTYQNRRGAADDWFFHYGGELVIIEFKKPKKEAMIHQKREIDRLIERGFRVFVIDTVEKGYQLHRKLENERRIRRSI